MVEQQRSCDVVREMLITELIKPSNYRLMERPEIVRILNEQDQVEIKVYKKLDSTDPVGIL